jgi:hypothetical protein
MIISDESQRIWKKATIAFICKILEIHEISKRTAMSLAYIQNEYLKCKPRMLTIYQHA